MTSQLMDGLGLGSLDIGYLFIGIALICLLLLILVIILIKKTNTLSKQYKNFMVGKDAKSLEKELMDICADNEFLKGRAEQNRKDIRKINKNLEITYQKMALIKYDAFKEMGGKLSYSLALLNNNNSGFILNSVHSSDGCYSYTKEIINGECAILLGEEEQKALDKAMGI